MKHRKKSSKKNASAQSSSNRQKESKLLKEPRKKYKDLFGTIPVGIIYHNKMGEIISANSAAEKIFGLSLKDIKGKTSKSLGWKFVNEDGSKFPAKNYPYKLAFKTGRSIQNIIMGISTQAYKGYKWVKVDSVPLFLPNETKPYQEYSVFVDVTESKIKHDELLESEDRFKKSYENNPESINITRLEDGVCISVNKRFTDITGYTRDEVIGKSTLELKIWYDPSDRQNLLAGLKKDGFIRNLEAKFLMKNGKIINVLLSAALITINKEKYIISMVRDISDIGRSNAEINKLSRQLNEIFNRISDGFVAFDNDLNYIFVNKAGGELLGRKAEDLIGKNYWTEYPEAKGTPFANAYLNALETQKFIHLEDYYVHWKRWFENNIYPSKEGISIFFKDITERKIKEKILQQKEKTLLKAQEVASMGFLTWDLKTNDIMLSAEARRIHGLKLDTPLKIEQVTAAVHPDDMEFVRSNLDKAIRGVKPYDIDHRLRLPDGSVRWVHAQAELAFEKDGSPSTLLGTVVDITKRKMAEQKLRQNEVLFRTTLYSIGEGIITTNSEGLVQQMNFTAENLTGWKEKEAVGKLLEEVLNIVNADTHDKVENTVQKVLMSGKVVSLANHTILISKDGREIPITDSGAPIRNENGNVEGVVLVFRDKTKEYQAEKLISESESRLKRAESVSKTGNWELHLDTRMMIASEGALKIYGESSNSLTYDKIKIIPLPEYRQMMDEALKNLIENNKPYDIEFKIRASDTGEIKDIHSIAEYDKQNRILFGVIQDITERKGFEAQLRKLSQAVEQSPVSIIITDLKGNIEYANPKVTDVTGYTFDELKGKNPRIFNSGKMKPEEYKKMWDLLLRGEVWHGEFYNKKKDGSLFWESASISPVKDLRGKITNYIAIKEDITEKKNMMNALIKSEEYFRLFYENAPMGYLSLDSQGKINKINNELLSQVGRLEKEVVNHPITEFLTESSRRIFENNFSIFINQGRIENTEYETVHKNGSVIVYTIDGRIIKNPGGDFKEAHIVMFNITDRKKTEEELLSAKQKAEDANKAKDLFLANMSHELRTPLIGILGYSEMLEEFLLDAEHKEMAKGIKRSGDRLLKTLNLVLDLTRIEANKLDVSLIEKDIREEIKYVYDVLKGAALDKNLELSLNILCTNLIANVDPALLISILENLLNNAIKFTKSGKITITAGKESDNTIFIKVYDTGIGIDEKYLDSIFEEFKQVSEGLNREYQGTGLGLSIAKRFAELMKGTIKVQSKFGEGSEFTLRLPSSV